ncbi:MAG TPA: sn-glycerol-3-phosphate ABC transporter ATP-binding protein UgpC [Salmonella bongori]|nr:sn-glycerol-3-phosphate ABC transporter ATP-binding protein UgpC [Salmonella bongori]
MCYAGERPVNDVPHRPQVKTRKALTPLLEIRNLTKSFDGQHAVDDVSLTIYKGEIFALLGASGCGKSTLLRMLAGFELPSSGQIILDGVDLAHVPPYQRPINMMFQSYALFPHMTVEQNIAFGLKQDKLPKAEIAGRVNEMLGLVHMQEFAKRKPHQLSGGQRQRVAMGRAIVRDPAVFLFDEPLSNLDAKLRVQMRLELQHLHRRLKTTSLYVTHDQVEAMTLAQRVMVMNKGVAEQVGTPVEVYEKPASRFVASFIGSPAMNLLDGVISASGDRFELPGGMVLPLGGNYRRQAGRKMTLGIRPEHIALSSQAEGGVPLTVDTLEILGADNLAHGRWGDQKLVVRLAHQQRPAAGSMLWLRLPENHLHLFNGETGQRV